MKVFSLCAISSSIVAAYGHTQMALNQHLQHEIGNTLEQREVLRSNLAKQGEETLELLIYKPILVVVPKVVPAPETTEPVHIRSRRNRFGSYHGN